MRGSITGTTISSFGLRVGIIVETNDILLLPIEYVWDGVAWESTISGIVKTESIGTCCADEDNVELSIVCTVFTIWLEDELWLSVTSGVEVYERVGVGKSISVTGVLTLG